MAALTAIRVWGGQALPDLANLLGLIDGVG
jgi:hypothetical protein